MNNKNLFWALIIIFVFASLGVASAKDIAYITKDSNNVDSSIVNLIQQGNYTHDIIYQTALDSTNFSNYKIILVGEGIYTNYSKIPVNKKNSVILNTYYLDEWMWSKSGISSKGSNRPSNVSVFDNTSRIVDGISTYFTPYYADGVMISYKVYYIPKSKKASGVNTIVADDLSLLKLLGIYTPKNGAVVATVNNGSKLINNNVANARGVFLGFPHTELWREDTQKIFYQAIEWAMNGEDKDGDGFTQDFDCNDSNLGINPNATEIAYDGIDQNCDGIDLKDVDGDGFDADCNFIEGICEIPGGNDCNDNSSEYNINSTDLTKNCVNDAPIIQEINNIEIHETENAEFIVYAEDSENDEMEYSINDSRFSQENNYFVWETGYNDAGNYVFNVMVSDGEYEIYKEVRVNVLDKNKAPELIQEIPAQEWNEDTNYTLNLSEYFYDQDGDELLFLFHNTSDSSNIILDKIENGTAYFSVEENWYGEDWIIFKATDLLNIQETNNITLRVLPVNDAPKIIKPFENLTMDEDTNYTLNLSEYFYDVEGELNYSFDNNPHLNLEIDDNELKITSENEWFGEEEINVYANDEEFEVGDSFIVKVISKNDAPQIENIEDKIILAGNKIELTVNASDIDSDENNLSYSINDSRFVQNENMFEWDTLEGDFGEYVFRVGVYDGEDYGYKNFNVNVLQKIWINEFIYGNDGWVELYNPENTTFDLSECKINNYENNELILNGSIGPKGFIVFEWDKLEKTDTIRLSCFSVLIDETNYEEFEEGKSLGRLPDGSNDSWTLFDYPTKGLSNSADVVLPSLELVSPENNSLITDSREITFYFNASDNIAEELNCTLIVNNKIEASKFIENNTEDNFYVDSLADGSYLWNIKCSDGTNTKYSEIRNINISAPDNPILNYIPNMETNENQELAFNIFGTDSDGESITFKVNNKPEGSKFTDNNDGTARFSWTPSYTQSGNYELEFIVEDSTGLKDSQKVNIKVNNAKEPPKFSDAEMCKLKNSSIYIDIKNPDEGDDFENGDKIDGKLKIKNNFNENMKFDVKIYLYDLDKEESVEETKENIKINKGNSKSLEFELEIPKDIEDSNFAVYVYAEDEKNRCNSIYSEINIKRKKHDVVVDKINLNAEIVSPGSELEVSVDIRNMGGKDENVFIQIQIPGLNISEKSEEFEIEKYGEDDSEKEKFQIKIPENAEEGNYEINVQVIFDDGKDSKTKSFGILNGIVFENLATNISESKIINLNGIKLSSSKNLKLSKTTSSAVKLGFEEKSQGEYFPEARIEFGGNSDNVKVKTNSGLFGLIAIILGIAVIVLFILIVLLR